MAVIKAKPTSPGRRGVISIKSDLYKGRPHKALLEKNQKMAEEIITVGLQLGIKAADISSTIESSISSEIS